MSLPGHISDLGEVRLNYFFSDTTRQTIPEGPFLALDKFHIDIPRAIPERFACDDSSQQKYTFIRKYNSFKDFQIIS